MKYSVALDESMFGSKSRSTLFTSAPRLIGVDQGCDVVLRVAVHKSELPNPPVLLEKKKTSSPSNVTDVPASLSGLLSSDTGAGTPNVPSGSRSLTKMSLPVIGIVRVKKSCGMPASSLSKRKGN